MHHMHAEGQTNRSSKSAAEMRLGPGHRGTHRWDHRLWVACRMLPLQRFLSEARAGEHETESRCTYECGGTDTRTTALHLLLVPGVYHQGLGERGSERQALATVKVLCECGADTNALSRDGSTPFDIALRNDYMYYDTVAYLLQEYKDTVKWNVVFQTTGGPMSLADWAAADAANGRCYWSVYNALADVIAAEQAEQQL